MDFETPARKLGRGWQSALGPVNDRLLALLQSSKFSDLTLTLPAAHVSFKVHRVVLAMSSPVWEEKLYGQEAEAAEVVYVQENDARALHWLLQHMYGGSPPLTEETLAVEALTLAHKYKMGYLYPVITTYLKEMLRMDTVLRCYNAAVLVCDADLVHHCLQLLKVYADEVLASSDVTLLTREALKHLLQQRLFVRSEVTVFQAVVKWAQKRLSKSCRKCGSVLRLELQDILPSVRILSLQVVDVIRHVFPSGIFTSEEQATILHALTSPGEGHKLPALCCPQRKPREMFDPDHLQKVVLPSCCGVTCASVPVQGSHSQVLVQDMTVSRAVVLHSVECGGVRIEVVEAVVRDASDSMVREVASQRDGVFDRPVSVVPGGSLSLLAKVSDRWYPGLTPFQVKNNGAVFAGLQANCRKGIEITYWNFDNYY